MKNTFIRFGNGVVLNKNHIVSVKPTGEDTYVVNLVGSDDFKFKRKELYEMLMLELRPDEVERYGK